MDAEELDELRNEIESRLNESDPFFREVIHEGFQIWMENRHGELVVVVEVWNRYQHYDDVQQENIEDAPGDVGEVGQMLVSMLESRFDETVELTLTTQEEVEMDFEADMNYVDRISIQE